jgi:hypothetical protein
MGESELFFDYVGYLTDSRRGQDLEWTSGGAAMAHYDPETLVLLRMVLDEAWAALPDGSKSETLKSEMAQHILKQAADGVRDPVRLRASALVSAVGEPPASEAKTRLKERDRLRRRARQAEISSHINEWLTSPGLASPK